MSEDLLSALALVLIIEGLLPFAAPQAMRKMWQQVSNLPDRMLRRIGFFSMLLGLVFLYLIKNS